MQRIENVLLTIVLATISIPITLEFNYWMNNRYAMFISEFFKFNISGNLKVIEKSLTDSLIE